MSIGSGLRARETARALLTTRQHGMDSAWPALLGELRTAERACAEAELVEVALLAVRMTAAALGAAPADVLAALLLTRAAGEVEPTTGSG
ncbi:MAG TPA: hypothetical protein VGC06_12035 [Actinomycetes bacterium]